MKFIIENQMSIKQGRLARLIFNNENRNFEFQTPLCLLYARNGSVPHVTHDVLERITKEKLPVLFPLPSVIDFKSSVRQFDKGVGDFCGMGDYPVYVTSQDPSITTIPGFNNKSGVSILGHGGRTQIKPECYMKILEHYKPAWFQSLSDAETPTDSSKKRVRYSVTRTLEYLDECLELRSKSDTLTQTAIFGCIEGGFDLKARQFSVKETSARPVDGFVIEGLHMNGADAANLDIHHIQDIIATAVDNLPVDKPRILHGPFNPDFILSAIDLGIDIFDATYPFLASERGAALVFNYLKKEDSLQPTKDNQCYEINLHLMEFKEDLTPILDSCHCYTCANFTKAYINHLLVTSEMLASVLLMVHNLSYFLGFFSAIRDSLRRDKFEEFKALYK